MVNLLLKEGLSIENNKYSHYLPGDVIAYHSNGSVPDGWLLCNGQVVTQSSYPDLYAVIGNGYNTVWSQSAPAAGSFRVPYLQGTVAEPLFSTYPWSGNVYAVSTYATHTHSATSTMIQPAVAAEAHSHNGVITNNTQGWGAHDHFANTSGTGNVSTNDGANTNLPSNIANRSNSTGNGANLASGGHRHEGVINTNTNLSTQTANHSHNVNAATGSTFNTSGGHDHNTNLTYTAASENSFPPHVITNFIIKV
jgi:microcystin-dependent protein